MNNTDKSKNTLSVNDEAKRLIKEVEDFRKAEFEKTLPKGKTYEAFMEEEVENIKKEINSNKLKKNEISSLVDEIILEIEEKP